jgi:ribosomal protein S18 acetylase RimI-like enzyme
MLWVEEAYRKRKVGSKLIDLLKRETKLPLKVECLKGNAEALNFYTSLGFEFIDKARFQTNLVGYTKVKLKN